MSIECSECEQDLRGGHEVDCTRSHFHVTNSRNGNDCTLRLESADGQLFEACVSSWWGYVAEHDDYNSDAGVSVQHERGSVFVGKYQSFGITVSLDVWAPIYTAMITDR